MSGVGGMDAGGTRLTRSAHGAYHTKSGPDVITVRALRAAIEETLLRPRGQRLCGI